MRKKFGFRDFIRKSLPLKHEYRTYTPLTRATFTDLSQIKKGMKLVYYTLSYGDISKRRTKHPMICKAAEGFNPSTHLYSKVLLENSNLITYLQKSEIFFYEEEKLLGRVE